MKRYLLTAFLLALAPTLAFGQGMIVPHDHRPIAGAFVVKSVVVEATIKEEVAQVQLTQTFRNVGSAQMEVSYVFPIPSDAVIEKFTLMVDGKEMPAKIYTKEEARHIYEDIVRSRRDPAILEYMGSGMLQTQVFPVPANQERQIVLKYTQICRRDTRVNEFAVPLSAAKFSSRPIEEIKFTAHMESSQEIKSIYSPTHTMQVARPTEKTATVTLEQKNATAADDLRLFWSFSEKPIGATLMSVKPDAHDDGYLLLLTAPEVKPAETKASTKTVVFVLDKSGSMSGKKIEQAKGALKFVLNNLREGDTFNIVDFNDQVQIYKPELQGFNNATRDEAIRYADNIFAGGSTNIEGAMRRALEAVGDTQQPSYVIFMTDGLPTVGEQKEAKLAEIAKTLNRAHARIFTFGVGYDVNARLLDRISNENFGTSDYVRPDEDIEATVARFYSKITAPVLANVKMELIGAQTNRIYPRDLPDLFAGGQLVCVGRYKSAGDVTIRITGKVGGKDQTYEFPAKLNDIASDDTYAFVEKLWAVRRVGDIINELDLKGQNKELVDELVALSTKHGILTPYTAFLADEHTDLHAPAANADKAGESVQRELQIVSGSSGVNYRKGKADMQSATTSPNQGWQGYLAADGKYRTESACQVVGNQALWRRNNRWIDPTISAEDEKTAEVIEPFSDKYFELANNNSQMRKFLAMPDGCTVRVQGRVYQINKVNDNAAIKGG